MFPVTDLYIQNVLFQYSTVSDFKSGFLHQGKLSEMKNSKLRKRAAFQ